MLENVAKARGITRVAAESLKFTTADVFLRSTFRSEGELSGFHNFATHLAKNTVMFGAFAGMERYLSGPLKDFILKSAKIENSLATLTIGTSVLTVGDVGVMQALYAAEQGKLEWDWKSAFQALAFRVGMKGGEKVPDILKQKFPKLAQKYEAAAYKASEVRLGMKVPKNLREMSPDQYKAMVERNGNLDPLTASQEVSVLVNEGNALSSHQNKILQQAHNHGTRGKDYLKEKYKILESK